MELESFVEYITKYERYGFDQLPMEPKIIKFSWKHFLFTFKTEKYNAIGAHKNAKLFC